MFIPFLKLVTEYTPVGFMSDLRWQGGKLGLVLLACGSVMTTD
jgi:hypothetical protein